MINFPNPEVLGLQHRYEYFDDVFNYRNVQTYNVRGKYLSTDEDYIQRIWTQINSGDCPQDFHRISLEGLEIGSGRLVSLNLSPGLGVREQQYDVTFDIYREGNLFNLTGNYYSGVAAAFAAPNLQFVENLSEDFSFSRNEDSTYSYQRNVSMNVINGQNMVAQAGQVENVDENEVTVYFQEAFDEEPVVIVNEIAGDFSVNRSGTVLAQAAYLGEVTKEYFKVKILEDNSGIDNDGVDPKTVNFIAFKRGVYNLYNEDGSVFAEVECGKFTTSTYNNQVVTFARTFTGAPRVLTGHLNTDSSYPRNINVESSANNNFQFDLNEREANPSGTISNSPTPAVIGYFAFYPHYETNQNMGWFYTDVIEDTAPVIRSFSGIVYSEPPILVSRTYTKNQSANNFSVINNYTSTNYYVRNEESGGADGVHGNEFHTVLALREGILYQKENSDPVNTARFLAQALFNTNPSIQFATTAYPNFYLNNGFKRHTERYDVVNGSFSFSESFDSAGNSPYIWTYGNSFSVNEGGITNISERGNIVGVSGITPTGKYYSARSYYSEIEAEAPSRLLSVYSGYINDLYFTGTGFPSIFPVSKTLSLNPYNGSVDYSFEFTNDYRHTITGYFHEYQNSLTRDNGIYNVSEQGSVEAFNAARNLKYSRTTGFFATISGGIQGRVDSFYRNSLYESVTGFNGRSLRPTNYERTYSEYEGTVRYNYRYSDDPSFIDHPLFSKASNTVEDSTVVHNYNKFNIFNYKEIAQPNYQTKLGTYTNNIEIQGKRSNILFADPTINDYLNHANTLIKFPNDALDAFIVDADYTFNPQERKFSMNVVYNYTRDREYDDMIVW